MASKPDKPTDEAQAETPPEPETLTLRVSGPPQGRGRAGLRFGPDPQDVTVSPDQAALIRSDPFLRVL